MLELESTDVTDVPAWLVINKDIIKALAKQSTCHRDG